MPTFDVIFQNHSNIIPVASGFAIESQTPEEALWEVLRLSSKEVANALIQLCEERQGCDASSGAGGELVEYPFVHWRLHQILMNPCPILPGTAQFRTIMPRLLENLRLLRIEEHFMKLQITQRQSPENSFHLLVSAIQQVEGHAEFDEDPTVLVDDSV